MQKFTAVKKQKNLGMWWISRAGWTETGARFHPWQSRQNFSFVGKIIKAKMSGKTERFIRNILTINNHFDFFLRQNVYPVLTGCPISLGGTLPSIGGWQGGGDQQLAGAVDCVNISSKNILMIICWFSSVTFPKKEPLFSSDHNSLLGWRCTQRGISASLSERSNNMFHNHIGVKNNDLIISFSFNSSRANSGSSSSEKGQLEVFVNPSQVNRTVGAKVFS